MMIAIKVFVLGDLNLHNALLLHNSEKTKRLQKLETLFMFVLWLSKVHFLPGTNVENINMFNTTGIAMFLLLLGISYRTKYVTIRS